MSAVAAARRLEVFTLSWNAAEAAVAIVLAVLANSIALLGFGFDSIIESLSGAVLLWRLVDEEREERALKLVGVSLFVLAAYVGVDATLALLHREHPRPTWPGVIVAIASLIAMPVLAHRKRVVAAQLGSSALRADAAQTDICAWLSAILLFGLGANALLGWWWADPVAALAMLPIIVREGWEAFSGEDHDDD